MSNVKRLQNQYRMLMICMINLGQEKNVLVLVIGRVDFDANKKMAPLTEKYWVRASMDSFR